MVHLYFYGRKNNELLLVSLVTLVGVIVDSLLQYCNVFVFENSLHIPLWLMTLWACFAATLSHSLNFLSCHKILQLLVGALLAPLSYIAGFKFDVVDFTFSMFSTYIILSIIWGILFVTFYALKESLVNSEVNHV